MELLWFLGGVVVGGIVMFFIFRNNATKFAAIEDELKKEVEDLKKKLKGV